MTLNFSRRAALGLAAGAVVTGLAGCSRFGGSTSGGAASGDSSHTIDVVWKGDAQRAKITKEAIALFTKQSPDVKVTTDYQSGSEYTQKLAVRFAGGNPPDLMRIERGDFREYGDRGVLLDLTSVGDVLHTEKIQSAILNSGKVGGKLLGVPMGVTSMAPYLNKKVFETYHVDFPDMSSWSWDDYGKVGSEVTKASKKKVWGFQTPIDGHLSLGIWLRQQGKNLWGADGKIAFEVDDIAQWFQMWLNFQEMGAVAPAGALDNFGASADKSPIGRGAVAGELLPPNSFSDFDGVAGGTLVMGYYPGESQGTQRGMQIIPGAYWSVSQASKDPKDAVALLDFFINDVAANKLTGATNGVPTNGDVAEAIKSTLSKDDQTAVDFIVELGKKTLTDYVPDPKGASDFDDALSTNYDKVLFKKSKPAEAAKEFMTAAQKAIGA